MTGFAARSALALGLFVGTAQITGALPMSGPASMGRPPLALPSAGSPGVVPIEYYCSPGFEPSHGGTCVAVRSRAEVELFVDQPIYGESGTRRYHHRRHRHALRERF